MKPYGPIESLRVSLRISLWSVFLNSTRRFNAHLRATSQEQNIKQCLIDATNPQVGNVSQIDLPQQTVSYFSLFITLPSWQMKTLKILEKNSWPGFTSKFLQEKPSHRVTRPMRQNLRHLERNPLF